MMAEGPRLLTVGTISGGSVAIQADIKTLGSDVAVKVLLSTDYAMIDPPGYPARPSFTGAAIPQYPHLVPSGTTLAVLRCEAVALVNAGAATLV
jgi:hypothetical protein